MYGQIADDVYKNKSLNILYTVNVRYILVCLGPYKMNKLMFIVFVQLKGGMTISLKSPDPQRLKTFDNKYFKG